MIRTADPATRHLPLVFCALCLVACTDYLQEPWTGKDAQWKQQHFVSETPDEALRLRAAHTQIDR